MNKKILNFTVTRNTPLSANYFRLTLTTTEGLPDIQPGQFTQVRIDHTPGVFLRRPLSIHDVDFDTQSVVLLVKAVGQGTNALFSLQAGMPLNLILPLGNGFTLGGHKHCLLIGGGCGVAPLLYLAKALHNRGAKPTVILGGRTQHDIVVKDLYAKYADVHITTEDGSLGTQGRVTQHPLLTDPVRFTQIYTCGPEPMMKAVAACASACNIACEASLENTMACGIGACLCCVQATHSGHQCVCTDGPVFNTKELLWQNKPEYLL